MITEQQSREAFEKWATFDTNLITCLRTWSLRGSYSDPHTQAFWLSWQAAIKFARERPSWIPCADRLPAREDADERGHVLWENASGRISDGLWNTDYAESFARWMPIPSSPAQTAVRPSPQPPASYQVTFTNGKINAPPFGQWHREDWTPDMLEGGYRPLTNGEKPDGGDQYLSNGSWWPILSYIESHSGCLHRRTRRPLPNNHVEDWVPLGPEDIQPGSVISACPEGGWDMVLGVDKSGITALTRGGETLYKWSVLFCDKWQILRPGQSEWQPCKKLKK